MCRDYGLAPSRFVRIFPNFFQDKLGQLFEGAGYFDLPIQGRPLLEKAALIVPDSERKLLRSQHNKTAFQCKERFRLEAGQIKHQQSSSPSTFVKLLFDAFGYPDHRPLAGSG